MVQMAAPPLHQPAGDAAALGPANRSDAWRWVFTAAVAYLVGMVVALVMASAGASIAGTRGGAAALARLTSPPEWYVVVTFAGLWFGFGGAAWYVTRSGRRVGLRFARTDIWYVFAGIALQLAVGGAYDALGVGTSSKAEQQLLGYGTGWVFVLSAVLTIVFAPLFEELFFRGVLLRGLLAAWRRTIPRLSVAVAVVIDGTFFGLAHFGTDGWAELPGLATVGVVLAVLAVRTRRLGPSIMVHAGFNAVAVYTWWLTR